MHLYSPINLYIILDMSDCSLEKQSQSCISYNVLVNDTTSEFDSSSDVSLFARSSTSIVSESSAADNLEVTITDSFARSSSSIMSELSTADDLDDTVIEAKTGVEPDYKTQCEEYKRLLENKIALEKYEEYKRLLNDKSDLEKDYQHLRESYTKLVALKEVAENKVKENELKAQDNKDIVNIKKVATRRTKAIIKAKSKRKPGSTKNIELSPCELPSCNTEDADLVLCSSCARYVCEACSGVPVNKLKQLVKVCGTIHYLCKDCSEITTDDCEKTCSSKNLEILQKNQKTLNDLLNDKDEIIESQTKIIESTEVELKETHKALLDSRVVLESKENELSKYLVELQLSKDKNPSDTGLKEANETLLKKLEDQNTLIEKTENAFKTQEKLLSTKCELIEGLKKQLSQKTPSCGNIVNSEVTADLTSQIDQVGTIETLKSFLSEQVTKIENNLKGMIETKLGENRNEIAVLNKTLSKANASSSSKTPTETNKTVTWSNIVSQEQNITTMMRDARNDEKIEESEKERRSKNLIIHGAEEIGLSPEEIKSEDN